MIDPSMFELPENRSVHAQTKLTPTESAQLDALVEEIRALGKPVTRSSVLRSRLEVLQRSMVEELMIIGDEDTQAETSARREREKSARGSRTEHERMMRRRDNEAAQAVWNALPSAMSTTKCPKCLYGQFDEHQGLDTDYVLRYWTHTKWRAEPGVTGAAIERLTKAHLLRRSCPRCGHFFFERPADCIGLELSDVD